jgi:hypothetical protein
MVVPPATFAQNPRNVLVRRPPFVPAGCLLGDRERSPAPRSKVRFARSTPLIRVPHPFRLPSGPQPPARDPRRRRRHDRCRHRHLSGRGGRSDRAGVPEHADHAYAGRDEQHRLRRAVHAFAGGRCREHSRGTGARRAAGARGEPGGVRVAPGHRDSRRSGDAGRSLGPAIASTARTSAADVRSGGSGPGRSAPVLVFSPGRFWLGERPVASPGRLAPDVAAPRRPPVAVPDV